MKYNIQKWSGLEKKVNPHNYELGGNMMQGAMVQGASQSYSGGSGNGTNDGAMQAAGSLGALAGDTLQSTGSSFGTIGGGALKGAAAGMALGPIGAVVGGAIGLVGGLLKNKQKKEEEAAQKEQEKKAMLANKQQAMFNLGQSSGGLGSDTRYSSNPLAYGGYLVNPITSFSKGGFVNPIVNKDKSLLSYQGGGTHQQNPLGGIPLGKSITGKQNTVEEGETSFKFKEGKYIFSNRLKLK